MSRATRLARSRAERRTSRHCGRYAVLHRAHSCSLVGFRLCYFRTWRGTTYCTGQLTLSFFDAPKRSVTLVTIQIVRPNRTFG